MRSKPASIDAYIAAADLQSRPILRRIRQTIQKAAPQAEEVISYGMPAFKQGKILIYFAAFKNHIGLYPPIKGNAALIAAAAKYAGPKGNLKFPLDEPIPYPLIARIVKHHVKSLAAKSVARSK